MLASRTAIHTVPPLSDPRECAPHTAEQAFRELVAVGGATEVLTYGTDDIATVRSL